MFIGDGKSHTKMLRVVSLSAAIGLAAAETCTLKQNGETYK